MSGGGYSESKRVATDSYSFGLVPEGTYTLSFAGNTSFEAASLTIVIGDGNVAQDIVLQKATVENQDHTPVTPRDQQMNNGKQSDSSYDSSSDDSAVSGAVTVSGNTATIAPMSVAQIQTEIGSNSGNAALTIDLTGYGSGIVNVKIPSASIKAIANALESAEGAGSLTILTAGGAATFNRQAISAIADQLGTSALTLTMKLDEMSNLSEGQTRALAEKEAESAFVVGISTGNVPITDFEGGTVVLEFPFTPKAGTAEKDYRAYYAAQNGSLRGVPSALTNGKMRLRTSHFSDYVVIYEPQTNPFSDLKAVWYYDPTLWAVGCNVAYGMGDGLFMPEAACTRAQAVTFLWRMSGSPEPQNMISFPDVVSGSWYEKAVAWAVENGITNGMDGAFNPDGGVTRAQAVTFLYRLESGKAASAATYADVPRGKWYSDAIAWAAENSITNSMGDNCVETELNCTRGQIVTFLYRDFTR